jgi:hypothetical protein
MKMTGGAISKAGKTIGAASGGAMAITPAPRHDQHPHLP